MLAPLKPRQTQRHAVQPRIDTTYQRPAGRAPEPAQQTAAPRWSAANPLWKRIQSEAQDLARNEPVMGSMVKAGILDHDTFGEAIAFGLSRKLAGPDMPARDLMDAFRSAYREDGDLEAAGLADLCAALDRDPACTRLLQPILYFKGFIALQAHRLAHVFWRDGRWDLALFIQSRQSEVFTLDIHPAARIGKGVMLDHAHSIVIGETAIVGDNVSILHAVTLGGTGKKGKDRHPKVGDDVMIGAGATILGNIQIGDRARIAAGSVVLKDVGVGDTVAGVPARTIFCEQDAIAGALSG